MGESRGVFRRRMQRRDFLTSTREGSRRSSQFFIAYVFDRGDGEESRLGITVTRKVGGAVRRNRIKRLVREWYRSRRSEFGSCDLVVIAKREFPESASFRDVSGDLDRALLPPSRHSSSAS